MSVKIREIIETIDILDTDITIRYSFDHSVIATEKGESLKCLFYITSCGQAHYLKLINDNYVFKTMSFKPHSAKNVISIDLLNAIAVGVETIVTTNLADAQTPEIHQGNIQKYLEVIRGLIDDNYPNLKIYIIDATGIFANAYPPTEDLILCLESLKKRQLMR